jgi:hypothetical protein
MSSKIYHLAKGSIRILHTIDQPGFDDCSGLKQLQGDFKLNS